MNPYAGCTHRCAYCYASFMCRFTGHQESWGQFLDVKVNFPAMLEKQLSGRSRREGRLIVGTVTDAYQPAEAHYGITRSCLEILSHHPALEVHILTKSALVVRDLAILRQLRACEVGFTVTTLEQKTAQLIEPGASLPRQRLVAARQLMQAGIPVWVFIAPLLPGLSDTEESLVNLLSTLNDMGIKEILLDSLNPYPAVVQRLRNIYRQYFSSALPYLEDYLRHPDVYQDIVIDRLQQINEQTGCQAHFI
ncbi:MAG: radical SAM protein [Syntrophomonadaceae bacterium]|nr:radical SAM protein [Syntrophomonadaceae bacterium]